MRRIFSDKKGIEIAVNYIVALVLGLATLSLGFVIIKTFVTGGDQSITLTSQQLNSKVADLLCGPTDIICFSDNNQQIHRSEYAVVGLHVKNILNNDADVTVTIDPSQTKFYPLVSTDTFDPTHVNVVPLSQTATIKAKDTQKLGFGLYAAKNANKGTYSFLVTVTGPDFGTKKDRILVQII